MRQRKCGLRAIALKGKTFCALREPQKVLVIELILLFPIGRAPDTGHRVDGLIEPILGGRPTPLLSVAIVQPITQRVQSRNYPLENVEFIIQLDR